MNINFNGLCNAITQIDEAFTENTAKAINKNVTARNWLTGYYIVHYEQNGNDRAKYGEKTLQRLAERLNKKSLSYRNLRLYRQFYMEFKNLARPVLEFTAAEFGSSRPLTADSGTNLVVLPPVETDLANSVCQIGQTPFAQSEKIEIPPEKLFDHLSYSHFLLIMGVENPLGKIFYELESMKGVWSFRELKRQIDSNYFERTALSKDPAKMSAIVQSRIAQSGHPLKLQDVVKSPYVYEFIGLKDKDVVEESDLEDALMNHLEEFLLELGNGFCFETRQKRILVDDDYFFCDLVFYHRILKCHVLIDLKANKIKYDDIAQMNLYLAYYRKNMMEKGDNPPVGILMCTKAGKELVEYTTAGIEESLFVQKYKLNLPAEDELTKWLKNEISGTRKVEGENKKARDIEEIKAL